MYTEEQALAHYANHLANYKTEFTQRGKRAKAKEWRPVRFACRNVILGYVCLRHQLIENIIEVDVFLSDDPEGYVERFTGTYLAANFILSDAFKCGSTMGVRFTQNVEDGKVPKRLRIYAKALGVELKFADKGFITPKEARMLYVALTNFSPKALAKVKELSLANLVTPERLCYLIHHGIWTKEEMESILLGCTRPEEILGGKVTLKDALLYEDALLRGRDVVLGGFLDRKLKLKERVDEEGRVFDLEGYERELTIGFDPKFFAKVYETQEDTPIPWSIHSDFVIPAGHRLVVMLRGYDWPDLRLNLIRDREAAELMMKVYRNDMPTYFFFLIPRDALEWTDSDWPSYPQKINDQVSLIKKIEEVGLTIMVCPEILVRLDSDVQGRFWAMEVMRNDVVDATESIPFSAPPALYNSTALTFVAVDPMFKEGILELPYIMRQAIYDEDELATGVNKRNVEHRYHRVMDRATYIAKVELLGGASSITFPKQILAEIQKYSRANPEEARELRLSRMVIPYDEVEAIAAHVAHAKPPLSHLAEFVKFLRFAKANGKAVIAFLDQHTRAQRGSKTQPLPLISDDLDQAFENQYVLDKVIDYSRLKGTATVTQLIWDAVNGMKDGGANSVNLNEVPHEPLTDALRGFIYRRQHNSPPETSVRIVYTDGSRARPFRFFALRQRTKREMEKIRKLPPMEIGMQSCRHPAMDLIIDIYWLLNIEVNQLAGPTSAEKDEFAYQETKRQLADITYDQPVRMNFYHTGFQPSVIGFYRGVVDFLLETQDRPPCLEVIPFYYIRSTNSYKRGESWF